MPRRLKLFIPLGLFFLLSLFLLRGLSLDPQELPSALINRPMPAFSLPSLGEERTLSSADVVGEPALFNVWATWCVACRAEHPYLEELAREGVPIYGINYKDDTSAAQQWLRNLGNPYLANIVDREGTLGLDLGVYGAPETYFVDAEGVIRYRHVGVIDERLWKGRLEPIYLQMRGELPQ